MGDFEDVFGAGANSEAIIDNIDRMNAREEDEDWSVYSSGQSIPRALSFYELTGTFDSLPTDVFETHRQKRKVFEKEAQMLAEALDGAWGLVHDGEWYYAEEFSRLLIPVTDRCCKTLAELGAFLIMVTCSLSDDAVLIRDSSEHNGMLGPGLSTYAIMLPQRFYLASFGKPDMRGPFWFMGNDDDGEHFDGLELADGLPGQQVLAVSKGVSGNSYPDWDSVIANYRRDANAWVAAHRQLSHVGGGTPFDHVARHARQSEGEILRTWSDRQEQNLRLLIQQLAAAILPVQANYEINLIVRGSSASIGLIPGEKIGDRISMPRHEAFKAALDTLIDLSSFRGRKLTKCRYEPTLGEIPGDPRPLYITLLDRESEAETFDDVLKGREVLLDLTEQNRLDRAAVEAAIVREDWKQLVAIFCAHPIERWATRDSPQERKGIREKYWGPRRREDEKKRQEEIMRNLKDDDLPSYLSSFHLPSSVNKAEE